MGISTRYFILVSCVVTLVACDPVKFVDCGSVDGVINSLDIIPCPSLPCEFKQGTNATLAINFTSKVDTQDVTAVVHATTQGVTVQFPLTQPDGCKSGVKCPVQNGATNVYNYTLPVDSSFPKLKLVVKWELQDDNKKDLACLQVPIAVV